jgi:hypothetical protein
MAQKNAATANAPIASVSVLQKNNNTSHKQQKKKLLNRPPVKDRAPAFDLVCLCAWRGDATTLCLLELERL